MPAWPVPQNAFSNAGNIVLLRCTTPKPSTPPKSKTGNGNGNAKERCTVEARLVTDQQLRPVIFGDVGMHTMEVYAERVEKLAVGVVTMRR
jgi:isopentenyl phosphate kinase